MRSVLTKKQKHIEEFNQFKGVHLAETINGTNKLFGEVWEELAEQKFMNIMNHNANMDEEPQ